MHMYICMYVRMYVQNPERPREAQRGPERGPETPREAQRGPERPREAQRGPKWPKEAQRGRLCTLVQVGERWPSGGFVQFVAVLSFGCSDSHC